MNVRYRVELSQAERGQLTEMLNGGKHAARKLSTVSSNVFSDDELGASVCALASLPRRFPSGSWPFSPPATYRATRAKGCLWCKTTFFGGILWFYETTSWGRSAVYTTIYGIMVLVTERCLSKCECELQFSRLLYRAPSLRAALSARGRSLHLEELALLSQVLDRNPVIHTWPTNWRDVSLRSDDRIRPNPVVRRAISERQVDPERLFG
jgi:hypothetical protein